MLLPLLCALSLTAGMQDPVRVTASLSAARVNVGESTTLQISVETPGEAPDDILIGSLPPGLQVVGQADFSQTQLSIPGGRSRLTRRDLVLMPTVPGVFRIPAMRVRVRGGTYHTTPLELVVVDGPAGARGGPASPSAGPHLSLWLQPDTVFVGDQVLLQAEAVFPDEMRLRQTRPASFDPPAPSGFWVQDLPNPITVSLRVLDGRTIELQTFRRAYFPLSAGRFAFPPARLHYELRRGFLYAPESNEIESDSARLIVLPLPEADRPESFTGAVGSFTLRAELAPKRVTLGDATTLVVELQGFGNVKALPEPKLPQLSGLEVYPPAQDSRIEVTDNRVGGTKRFRWVIVPERAGRLMIPPIEYSYFDPAERKYQILRTDSLLLEAVPVVAYSVADTSLRPLRTEASTPRGWIRSPAFVLLQTVPLFALFLLVAVRRRRERIPSRREMRAAVIRVVDALRAHAADRSFLTALERTLERGIRDVLRGTDPAAAQLRAAGAHSAADRLDALVAELRRLRFAPAERFDTDVLLAEAVAILREVPVSRRKTKSTAAAVLLIGIVGAAGTGAAAGSALASTADWQAGVEAFRTGAFVEAANRFYAEASAQPASANAWYNHGLAAYRAGDPGRAVWAWLRAARLAPRDRDVVHNLRVAGADDALTRIRPFDRLTADERLLLAAVAWWLLAAAIGLRIMRQRRAVWFAAPAVLLGTLAIAGMIAARTHATYVTPLGTGTQLLAAPHLHAESLGRFEPGMIARVRGRRIGYVLVAIDEVREAWVERGAVATP